MEDNRPELQQADNQESNELEDLAPLAEELLRMRENKATAELQRLAGSDFCVTIRFDSKTLKQLREISVIRETPVSTIIKNLVRKWLADNESANGQQS